MFGAAFFRSNYFAARFWRGRIMIRVQRPVRPVDWVHQSQKDKLLAAVNSFKPVL
jgi:hypothetical protein